MRKKWTLPRYYQMLEWWSQYGPPVYASVAGYLGLIKPKSSKPGKPAKGGHKGEDLNELFKFAGPGGMIQ